MAWQYDLITIRADGLSGRKASEYEGTILGMLRALDTIQTGHALLDGFRWYKRQALVIPYNKSVDPCNAEGGSDWGLFNSKVWFTPRSWFGISRCFPEGMAGNSAHEVFVHELVHALRAAAGKFDTGSLPREEEMAVMVTNIFSSETHRPQRESHNGFDEETDSVLKTSRGFLDANQALIEKFCKQLPDVSRWLARVPAPWNPLQEYWAHVPVSAGGWGN